MSPSRQTFEPAFRSVIFDLDETLIDSRTAWRYTLEETLRSVSNRRIDTAPLVEEYHRRPWRDSLAILIDDAEEQQRAEALCERIAGRSAMKRLLVFDGTGMALDEIRGARVEIGVISRLPHAVALKQSQATGLDRFLTVLSATPAEEGWDVAARAQDCLAYFGREAATCVFIGNGEYDLKAAHGLGMLALQAGWADADAEATQPLADPAAAAALLLHGPRRGGLPLQQGGG